LHDCHVKIALYIDVRQYLT